MMRAAILGLAICSLEPITSCSQRAAEASGSGQLNPMIQPADREKYNSVRDAKDWANPYLVIRADGVELISPAASRVRQTIPASELQKSLLKLPLSGWPYGKVVAVSEISIRSGNDDELIEQNKAKVEQILKSLQVEIEWWPS